MIEYDTILIDNMGGPHQAGAGTDAAGALHRRCQLQRESMNLVKQIDKLNPILALSCIPKTV